MYEQFYNFSAEPFRLSPDHGFAYAHKGYTKARAYMAYAFLRAEGFVMITGRPGTGKTTLIGALVSELADKSVNVANLVCTQLQAHDLLRLVAYDFGVPVSVVEKGDLLQRLTQQLKSWHRDGRRALLIVDEAQDLSISAMEELRLLTNIQVDSKPLLQIFLLGQPELRELILSPQLEQVHQRIIAATHLTSLESDETEAYIRHRLEAVHWHGNPAISKPVYPLIYKFSEGVPRRINMICSRLFLHCAVERRDRVTVADVREVVQELQGENLASGNTFSEKDFDVVDVFDAGVSDEEAPPDSANENAHVAPIARETVAPDEVETIRPPAQAINKPIFTARPRSEVAPHLKVLSGGSQAVQADRVSRRDSHAAPQNRVENEDSPSGPQARAESARIFQPAQTEIRHLRTVRSRGQYTIKDYGETATAVTLMARGKSVPGNIRKIDRREWQAEVYSPPEEEPHASYTWPLVLVLIVAVLVTGLVVGFYSGTLFR